MAGQLGAYIAEHATRPFSWAGNNCLGFVSGALEAQGLAPLPRDWWHGFSTTREAVRAYRRALARYGHSCIVDAMDARFDRAATLHPSDGMICARRDGGATGYGFGVAMAQGCVFLTDAGARWTAPQAGDLIWGAA